MDPVTSCAGSTSYRSMLTAPIIIIPFFTNYYLPTVHQTQTPLCGWNHRMSARFITTTTGIYGNMGIGNGRIDSHILQQAVSSLHFIKIVNLPRYTEVGTGQISFYMKLKQFDGSKVSKLLSLRDYCDAWDHDDMNDDTLNQSRWTSASTSRSRPTSLGAP